MAYSQKNKNEIQKNVASRLPFEVGVTKGEIRHVKKQRRDLYVVSCQGNDILFLDFKGDGSFTIFDGRTHSKIVGHVQKIIAMDMIRITRNRVRERQAHYAIYDNMVLCVVPEIMAMELRPMERLAKGLSEAQKLSTDS